MEKLPVEMFDDQDEESEDLTPAIVSQAVVFNTDWTVDTILSQLTRKNIDMPEWQRRDAWARRRKSRYIESLMLGLPVPQIILAERKDKRGNFLVLDGKQRLLSILQFTGNDKDSANNCFKLQGLEILKEMNGKKLNGKTYYDINKDPDLRQVLEPFSNQTIHAIIIRNWPIKSFLQMLFVRLNSETLPLSPQELCQALFPGDFVKYVDSASRKSSGMKTLLGLGEDEVDLRMRDVELLVRYLAFSFFLSDYEGNLREFLDTTCDRFNKEWDDKQELIEKQVQTFEDSVNTSIKIFGPEYLGRKWTEEGYSTRLNKAILDILNFYFSDEQIRKSALRNSKAVVEAFKELCIDSERFRNSIETTTKSLDAVSTRLNLWGKSLQRVTKLDFNVPKIKENRIKFVSFW